MRIEVTEEDIAQGERDNCFKCPIAVAADRAIRALGSPVKARVTRDAIEVWGGQWAYVQLPEAATNFVRDFDAQFPVAPFAFDVDYRSGVWS